MQTSTIKLYIRVIYMYITTINYFSSNSVLLNSLHRKLFLRVNFYKPLQECLACTIVILINANLLLGFCASFQPQHFIGWEAFRVGLLPFLSFHFPLLCLFVTSFCLSFSTGINVIRTLMFVAVWFL